MNHRSAPIRILIADHYPMVRDGLRILLEAEQGYRVVGDAAHNAEAVRLAHRLKPDILLLDFGMVSQPGLTTLHDLARSAAQVRTILLVSAAIEQSQIIDVFQLGVRGVVLKNSPTQLLHESIRSVMAGQYWLGRESVSDLAQALNQLHSLTDGTDRRKTFRLTPRELEIIGAIVAGYTNKDIAQSFSLSQQTIKHHLTNIFDKLGVSNRLELALLAVHHGLVEDEKWPRSSNEQN